MKKNSLLIHPVFIFLTLWAGVIVFSNLLGNFYPYSHKLYLYMAGVGVIFSTVCMLVANFIQKMNLNIKSAFKNPLLCRPNTLISIYISLMCLSLILQCISHWEMVGSGWWLPRGLERYRALVTTYGESPYFSFTLFFNYFFFSAIPVILALKNKIPVLSKVTIFLLLLLFFYISASRSTAFVIILLAFFFWLHTAGHYMAIYKLVLGGGMLLGFLYGLFVVFGSLLGKYGGFSSHFFVYFIAPSHALDLIINGSVVEPDKMYSFRVLQIILDHLGLINIQSIQLPDYHVPFTVNVYTMFGPYVLDYGLSGSFLCVAIFALISGLLYGLVKKYPGNAYFIFLSALNLTIIVLSVFYDYYTSSGFVWLSILLGVLFFPKTIQPLKAS